MTARLDATAVARALGSAERTGDGSWRARCPAHRDASPSLSLRDADDGQLLVYCFGGCSQAAVIDELRARGLWPNGTNGEREGERRTRAAPGTRPPMGELLFLVSPIPADAPPPMFEHPKLGRPASSWLYRDSAARTLFFVCRFEKRDGGKGEKRCGKTTTLTVTSLLLPRALLASNTSTASIFRAKAYPSASGPAKCSDKRGVG